MRLLQRFHDWLVWSRSRVAYIVLFLFAVLPFAVAPVIGTWKTVSLKPEQAEKIACPTECNKNAKSPYALNIRAFWQGLVGDCLRS